MSLFISPATFDGFLVAAPYFFPTLPRYENPHLKQNCPGIEFRAFTPCVILAIMERDSTPPPEWIRQARACGLGHALGVALDVLAPLGPLGAQMVWVAQPVLGLVVGRAALDDLARALEQPGGVDTLRAYLDDEP